MPLYKKFEDLPVWKSAKELAVEIYRVSKGEEFRRDYGLVEQIRKAAISIKEFIRFLYIAKASLGEVRSQLQVCLDLGYINRENLNVLLAQTHDLSSQLGAFISSIRRRMRT